MIQEENEDILDQNCKITHVIKGLKHQQSCRPAAVSNQSSNEKKEKPLEFPNKVEKTILPLQSMSASYQTNL